MARSGQRAFPGERENRRENPGLDKSDRLNTSVKSNDNSNPPGSEYKRVQVEIYGQVYNILGTTNPEKVGRLAGYVDDKMKEIASNSKGISALKIAILAALNIAEEVDQSSTFREMIAKRSVDLISLLEDELID